MKILKHIYLKEHQKKKVKSGLNYYKNNTKKLLTTIDQKISKLKKNYY